MELGYLIKVRQKIAIVSGRIAWRVLSALVLLSSLNTFFYCTTLKIFKELNEILNILEKNYHKKKLTSLPITISIDTTAKCQLKCRLCFRQHHKENLNERPDIRHYHLKKIIKELFPTAKSVGLTMIGEPLLSSHLKKIIKEANKYHVKMGLVTNGMLLDKVINLDGFIDNLGSIEISLDSLKPKIFEKLRANASYTKVIENIDLLKDIRTKRCNPFSLGFSVTLLSCNIEELPEIINFASMVGGNWVRCCFGVIYSRKDSDYSILHCIDKYNDIHDKCRDIAAEKGIHLSLPSKIVKEHHCIFNNKEQCNYIYNMIRIDNDGNFTSCLHYNPQYVRSINKVKIRKIWNSPEMQLIRETYDTDSAHYTCKNCYIINRQEHSKESLEKQLHYFNNPDSQNNCLL